MSDTDDLGWLMNLLLSKAEGRGDLYGICTKAIRRAHEQLRRERIAGFASGPLVPTSADKPPHTASVRARKDALSGQPNPRNPSPTPEPTEPR